MNEFCIDKAGNTSAPVSATINIDKTPPVAMASAIPVPNANGWNNTSVTVTSTGTDLGSGIDFCTGQITLLGDGSGQSGSGTCTDKAGNVSAPATITGINIGKTPPTVTFGAPNPAPNPAGWNNTNVTMPFTASGNPSGVASTNPTTSPLLFSTDGAAVMGTVTVTDKAGNSATVTSPAVKIDKTPPLATTSVSPTPNSNGWNNTNVTVSFTGTDILSGIASCSPQVVFSGEGANQSASGICTDAAGNTSQPATVSHINIDKTPPTISGMPVAGCSLWPPNKKLVQIAAITAADPGSAIAPGSLAITVTSNEPVDAGDIVVNGGVVQVIADRLGDGNGRVYTVQTTVSDLAGNLATATGTCTVPHDQSN